MSNCPQWGLNQFTLPSAMGESISPHLGGVFENIANGQFNVYKAEKLELDPQTMDTLTGVGEAVGEDGQV